MDLLICGQLFSVSQPKPEFDDLFSEFFNRKSTESPIITFFCKSRLGEKVALNIHKFYPKFYLEIPNKCTFDPFSFALKLESLFSSPFPIIHRVTETFNLSIYGFQTSKTRFFKVEVYNSANIKKLAELCLDGFDGFNFQPYEAHIDTFQHFYAEFNVSGMDWITVNDLVFRQNSVIQSGKRSIYSKTTNLNSECDCVFSDIQKNQIFIGKEFGNISIPPVYKIWKTEALSRKRFGQELTERMFKIPFSFNLPQDYSDHPDFCRNFQLVKGLRRTSLDFLSPRPRLVQPEQQLNFEDDQKILDDMLDISKPKALVSTPVKKNNTLVDMLKTPFQASVEKMFGKLNPGKTRKFYYNQSDFDLKISSFYEYNLPPPSYSQVQASLPHGARTINQPLFISESSPSLVAGVTDTSLISSMNLRDLPDFAQRLSKVSSKTDVHSNQYLYKPLPPSFSQVLSQSQRSTQDSELTPVRKNIEEVPPVISQIVPLCIMYIEIFCLNREDLLPDPSTDAVIFVFIVIRDDLGDSKELVYHLGQGPAWHVGKNKTPIFYLSSEKEIFKKVAQEMQKCDPDVIVSFEAEKMGIGYMIKRSKFIHSDFINKSSRQPKFIVQQTYKYKKLSSLIPGRIILSCWRLVKSETHFYSYTLQNLLYSCLNIRFPSYTSKTQSRLFNTSRLELYDYIIDTVKYSKKLLDHFGILERNITLAQIYGIDYESVFTRGSQFRVEAMLKKQISCTDFLLLSALKWQVSSQTTLQCVPLVMEPPKNMWTDPILVLDFQSLYPSIMIAYNLCYSTCLGKILSQEYKKFGVTKMKGDVFGEEDLIITPNNVAFVKKNVRTGFVPVMMHELLQSRIMIKNSMKLLDKNSSRYQELFIQQFGIKMLCNTTYGYAGAGDTGRMPCNDIADSIVAIARRTLEDAINVVNSNQKWQGKVVYGDTDSMMVHLPGRTVEQAFEIGKEISRVITERNPKPVELLFEKVYFPMITLAKKHYAGMKYEKPDSKPYFESKGIETVRTDYCPLSSKILEGALVRLFEHRDITKVYKYLTEKWRKILAGKYYLKDFIMYEKVIMGEYKNPPAGIKVSLKNIQIDNMRKPLFGERVGFVIRNGEPGETVTDLAMNPEDFVLSQEYSLNIDYYMEKQINAVLDRTLAPIGIDIKTWFKFMPKKRTVISGDSLEPKKSLFQAAKRIDRFFQQGSCVVCKKFVNGNVCEVCRNNPQKNVLALMACMNKRERKLRELLEFCRGCSGSLNEVLCSSLDCPVYYMKIKLGHESFAISKRMEKIQW